MEPNSFSEWPVEGLNPRSLGVVSTMVQPAELSPGSDEGMVRDEGMARHEVMLPSPISHSHPSLSGHCMLLPSHWPDTESRTQDLGAETSLTK